MSPSRFSLPSPERRTRGDIIASALIAAGLLVGGVGVWLTSDAHSVEHHVANDSSTVLATGNAELPQRPRELWTTTTQGKDLVVDQEGVVQINGTKVRMLEAATGAERWSYDKGEDVCAVTKGWEKTTVVFRGPKGCGQAISFDSKTGQYWSTRDSIAPDDVASFRSEDIIGILSPARLETWRSDLVRTVEVGKMPTPVKVGKQEYTHCNFTSVGTAGTLLATVQECPGEKNGKKYARLLNTTPEDSDAPESWHVYRVPAGSEIIGANEHRAAIAIPAAGGKKARIQSLDKEGHFEEFPVDVGPDLHQRLQDHDSAPFQPLTIQTGSMAGWFNGRALVALNPETFRPLWTLPGAQGVGTELNGKLAVPMRDNGIALVDPSSGKVERTIGVDRGGYEGPVEIAFTGQTILEKRGAKVVALGA